MSAAERAKGVRGEREAAGIWEAAGATIRNLEATGDHTIWLPPDVQYGGHVAPRPALHEEVKRQERLQLWQWLEQAEQETEPGAVAVVTFRRNRSQWYSALRTVDLAEMLTR
jgi:hypothetical protein